MDVYVVLFDLFQLGQVRSQLVFAHCHHFLIIKMRLLHQLAELPVEEHLANVRPSVIRALIELFLDDSRTCWVGKQSLS